MSYILYSKIESYSQIFNNTNIQLGKFVFKTLTDSKL
jgi:hypothetical protein